MAKRYPVPRLVLLSDARNDAVLARAFARRAARAASGLVFRHYLDPPARARLCRLAQRRGPMA
jgi:thiamine-phosphate pyrophosphorylase